MWSRPTTTRPPRRRLASALALVLVSAAGAAARPCGDDVNGRRVACRCGDTVVSRVRLDAHHPVTTAACPGSGLVVSVPPDAAGAVIDLAGATVAGAGRGIGLQLVRGDVVLQGPGTVSGFDLGVVARGGGAATIADLTSRDHRADGIVVSGRDVTLARCTATRNGRHGIVARGAGMVLEGNVVADNGGDGLVVAGRGGRVDATNAASGNARAAARVAGRGHTVEGALAPPPPRRARRHHCPEGASCR